MSRNEFKDVDTPGYTLKMTSDKFLEIQFERIL